MQSHHELSPFKVTHKGSGKFYFLYAASGLKALEIVTLKLGDVEGRAAWEVASEAPPFPLEHGALCDASGHSIHAVDY